MANKITLNETSYFGKGAINEIITEVKARGCQHVVVVTDKDLMKFKVATKITDLLDVANIPTPSMITSNRTRRSKTSRMASPSAKKHKPIS